MWTAGARACVRKNSQQDGRSLFSFVLSLTQQVPVKSTRTLFISAVYTLFCLLALSRSRHPSPNFSQLLIVNETSSSTTSSPSSSRSPSPFPSPEYPCNATRYCMRRAQSSATHARAHTVSRARMPKTRRRAERTKCTQPGGRGGKLGSK